MSALAVTLGVGLTAGPSDTPGDATLPFHRGGFLKRLADEDKRYDADEKMIRCRYSTPGYHSFYKGEFVHPSRESMDYAIALLDSGDPERLPRAEDILRKVISLQDQAPESRTYGIWSWYLEEPLDRMSPPDWNWADFIGARLVQVARDHGDRLPPEVQSLVRDSILHAARSIQRRNVGPGYTNIALMGTYVTYVAGELFEDDDLLAYARERLSRFLAYTKERGSFSEYNSPTYTRVAVEEIARMRAHIADQASRPMLEELDRLAWLHIARRFHPPTGQWAGPHSRCYDTFLGHQEKRLLQRATAGGIRFMSDEVLWQTLDALRPQPACPADTIHYFAELRSPRTEIETFQKRGAGPHDVVGTTYLHPEFALGSVNIGDLWNQRRPLLAYWNVNGKPAAMRLRCLHDGYDYSSATFFAAQQEGTVMAAVAFATDRGDTHISIDRIKDATIEAEDLRLRLQLEGAGTAATIEPDPGNARRFRITSGNIRCIHDIPYATFGDGHVRIETGRDKDTAFIDVVLYCGEKRQIRFDHIGKAAVVLGLAMGAGTVRASIVTVEENEQAGRVEATVAREDGKALTLVTPYTPKRTADQWDRFQSGGND